MDEVSGFGLSLTVRRKQYRLCAVPHIGSLILRYVRQRTGGLTSVVQGSLYFSLPMRPKPIVPGFIPSPVLTTLAIKRIGDLLNYGFRILSRPARAVDGNQETT
jgi:hypothetical protein